MFGILFEKTNLQRGMEFHHFNKRARLNEGHQVTVILIWEIEFGE
jgi:hypothetical protein